MQDEAKKAKAMKMQEEAKKAKAMNLYRSPIHAGSVSFPE